MLRVLENIAYIVVSPVIAIGVTRTCVWLGNGSGGLSNEWIYGSMLTGTVFGVAAVIFRAIGRA